MANVKVKKATHDKKLSLFIPNKTEHALYIITKGKEGKPLKNAVK